MVQSICRPVTTPATRHIDTNTHTHSHSHSYKQCRLLLKHHPFILANTHLFRRELTSDSNMAAQCEGGSTPPTSSPHLGLRVVSTPHRSPEKKWPVEFRKNRTDQSQVNLWTCVRLRLASATTDGVSKLQCSTWVRAA